MPLILLRDDITNIKCDVIVNATNTRLRPGGNGVDARIHTVAGPRLLEECKKIGKVKVGKAVVTGAYGLPSKKVFHTAGPIWKGGKKHEEELLVSCYTEALTLAADSHFESIAFPLISSGNFGYPKKSVIKVATDAIQDFLLRYDGDMTVYLVVYDKDSYEISEKLFCDVKNYINDEFEASVNAYRNGLLSKKAHDRRLSVGNEEPEQRKMRSASKMKPLRSAVCDSAVFEEEAMPASHVGDLSELISSLDVSFPQMLTTLIDLKGMADVECYKKANVSRQTWHKIISDKNYSPSKNTVLSFAIVLKLTYDETQALLKTVGMTLSD
ncbi:MAG: macro domain-containing protein, partial [Clostridia bacterium]|nr:macro domain-containing protein [Clostridia bacterium]